MRTRIVIADVNKPKEKGQAHRNFRKAPLLLVELFDPINIARQLVAHGADVGAPGGNDATVLHLAATIWRL
jgi:hypothetical protein